VGALKVEHGVLTQGLVIALYNYMSQILVELIKMANLIITITKAVACGNRVQNVLSLTPDQENGCINGAEIRGEVEYRDVSVRYSGAAEPSLEHISFKAAAEKTVGIIGGTGDGKSSLVHLIPRFYDVMQGEVLVDGRNVKDYTLYNLREGVSMVLQKNVLFSGTIRENLLWGNENATDEEIALACKFACADEFINSFPDGYQTDHGQGGVNVSGGQKQRLCIARAILKKPKIMILDDSTSAVDTATDAKIRAGLKQLTGMTTIIIAQRISSVCECDKIVVLDDGKINAIGTHDELLASCEIYQEVYHSQQKGTVEGGEN
jgi:ATP-binding cassette subfamily B protein